MGIGSEGVVAVRQRRRFIGVELKDLYYHVARKNLVDVEANVPLPFPSADDAAVAVSLFDAA
jgi:hypothetical protein